MLTLFYRVQKGYDMLNFDALRLITEKFQSWMAGAVQMIPNLLMAVVIVVFFWLLSKVTYSSTMRLFKKTDMNKSLEQLIASILKATVICLGFIVALNVLALDKAVFSLLAGIGVVGLALGFAFQDLASNFISGVMISINSPFKIGQVIKIGDVLGTVAEINLRSTRIKNFDGQDILIPNKEFTTNNLINYSSHGMRKVSVGFGIGYGDDINEAREKVVAAISEIPDILKDPEPAVNFSGFGASSVDLTAWVWITYPGGDFLGTQNQMAAKIKDLADKGTFEIPFPIRTLDFPEKIQKQVDKMTSLSH